MFKYLIFFALVAVAYCDDDRLIYNQETVGNLHPGYVHRPSYGGALGPLGGVGGAGGYTGAYGSPYGAYGSFPGYGAGAYAGAPGLGYAY